MPSISTHPSLLLRVRNVGDQAAWREFEAAYGDLIVRYGRRCGLRLQDAEDVRQIVLLNLARSLPTFTYEPGRGRFRTYLGRAVRHAVQRRIHGRAATETLIDAGLLSTLTAGTGETDDARWEEEWVHHHCRRALRTLRESADARSVDVFNRLMAGQAPADIAAALQLTPEAVRKVKQRLRERLTALVAQQVRDEERAVQHVRTGA